MKKVIVAVLIVIFLFACSSSEKEQTKNEKFNYDTTYEQLLSEYKFAEKTDWKSEDGKVLAQSVIGIEGDDLMIDQTIVFQDENVKEIVWGLKNKSIVIKGSDEIKEVLTNINKQKPLMKRKNASDKLKNKMKDLFDKYKDKAVDRIEDEINDVF